MDSARDSEVVSTDGRYESILKGIDTALGQFGTDVRQVVYYRLKVETGLTREEITMKTDIFADFGKSMFGVAWRTVELRIIREIQNSTGYRNLSRDNLSEAIKQAKGYMSGILGDEPRLH